MKKRDEEEVGWLERKILIFSLSSLSHPSNFPIRRYPWLDGEGEAKQCGVRARRPIFNAEEHISADLPPASQPIQTTMSSWKAGMQVKHFNNIFPPYVESDRSKRKGWIKRGTYKRWTVLSKVGSKSMYWKHTSGNLSWRAHLASLGWRNQPTRCSNLKSINRPFTDFVEEQFLPGATRLCLV